MDYNSKKDRLKLEKSDQRSLGLWTSGRTLKKNHSSYGELIFKQQKKIPIPIRSHIFFCGFKNVEKENSRFTSEEKVAAGCWTSVSQIFTRRLNTLWCRHGQKSHIVPSKNVRILTSLCFYCAAFVQIRVFKPWTHRIVASLLFEHVLTGRIRPRLCSICSLFFLWSTDVQPCGEQTGAERLITPSLLQMRSRKDTRAAQSRRTGDLDADRLNWSHVV